MGLRWTEANHLLATSLVQAPTEVGTHEELLVRRGVYRKLYDLQFLEEERPVTV